MFLPHNLPKLVTKEDPSHIHKFLGTICLINYGYRYYLLVKYGSMDLDNHFAAILVLFHATLSCTSIVFHIPAKRNKGAPMIYPEYRLHSILFVLRSVVCYFLTLFDYSIGYKFAACYATMILADVITAMHQSEELTSNTTMRNMPFDKRISEEEQQEITLMQSSQQIGATLYMFGNLDSCFSPMFAIQIAAFLMTMVRKSIIDSNMWHLVYNISLWMNVLCFYSLPTGYLFAEVALFQLFYYWRFANIKNRPRLMIGNKYIGWTAVFALLYFYNKAISENGSISEKVTDMVSYYNMDAIVRNVFIAVYLVTQINKSKGLLVVFRPKIE